MLVFDYQTHRIDIQTGSMKYLTQSRIASSFTNNHFYRVQI